MNYVRSIFVFGSNRQGRHGKGAALAAKQLHGAVYGQPKGLQGNSYAIITKDLRLGIAYRKVTLKEIKSQVDEFLVFAENHLDWEFNVSPIGCGLAGFVPKEIAPLFVGHSPNIKLPPEFITELTNGK